MLEKIIIDTLRNLINQRRDDLYREKLISQKKLQSNFASSGFSRPPGIFFVELSKLHEELIRKIGNIICESIVEVLDAYNPSYYSNLANDLKQEISIYLGKSLGEPEDYRCNEWHDSPHRNREEEKFQLENLIHSSLYRVNTQIDLYVAKIKSKTSNSTSIIVTNGGNMNINSIGNIGEGANVQQGIEDNTNQSINPESEKESIFKKPLFYIVLFSFIYFMSVA